MTTDLTPEELASLRERAVKAQADCPGPWGCYDGWGPTADGDMAMQRIGNAEWGSGIHGDLATGTDIYARRSVAEHIATNDPETVLRLVAMAERRIPGGDVLAGDLTRALQERDAMAERAAPYREALEFYADFDNWEVPGDSQAYRRAWEVARAALAEPKEAN